MANGEKYRLSWFSLGVMTFYKYLVPILVLLLAGSNTGWAVDDSTNTGSTGTATASNGSNSTHQTIHHKKHHTAGTPGGTNAAPAATSSSTGKTRESTSERTTNSGSSSTSARNSGVPPSKPEEETTGNRETKSTGNAAATSSAKPTEAAAKSETARQKRHHHGSTIAGTTNTTTAPETAANASTTKPSAPAAKKTAVPATGLSAQPASEPTTTTSSTATTSGKGRHHRHGKTTTAAKLPEPTIVVPETHPSLVTPSPTTTAVLPTAPPLEGNRSSAGSSASVVPVVQTGLPVGRPGTGTTATLPIAPFRSTAPALVNFPFKDYSQRQRTRTYPWRMSILTTVFWIGEGSTPLSGATNKVSAWDMSWVHNNGGADDQNDMSGYASAGHASTLNPFYVALPFNDLAYPDKSARWLPSGWYKGTRHGDKPLSACKDRWVEIKSRSGRVCFAQWEDVGPVVTDDAEYVFGGAPPNAMQGRGLDVSPAVAKYLGFESAAYTSWRFVDDGDVAPGMWLRYDEQALLFRAIKESLHGSPTPRIQDLDEPVSDPDDSSQKKAGAARG